MASVITPGTLPMKSMIVPSLTKRDDSVLQQLLGSEKPNESDEKNHVQDQLPILPLMEDDQTREIMRHERDILQRLNIENPDSKVITATIKDLTSILKSYPDYAPAYVNRAQARRLLVPTAQLFTVAEESSTREILEDLAKGISTASPTAKKSRCSEHQRQLLASAYAHQAYLCLRAADAARESPERIEHFFSTSPTLLPRTVNSYNPEIMEELASQMFEMAGRYGDQDAKKLAVKTNPYAKMCGAMVERMMKEEYGGC